MPAARKILAKRASESIRKLILHAIRSSLGYTAFFGGTNMNCFFSLASFFALVSMNIHASHASITRDDIIKYVENSMRTWQQTREQISNNYRFTVSFNWPPSSTTMTILNGTITARSYHELFANIRWSEDHLSLDTHHTPAPLATIDDLYSDCLRDIRGASTLEEDAEIQIAIRSDGIISMCSVTPCSMQVGGSLFVTDVFYQGMSDDKPLAYLNHSCSDH